MSPAKKVVQGKTLADYHNVILDMCYLTVTLLSPSPRPPPAYLANFASLLTSEGIRHYPLTNALKVSTLQIASPTDMHRLICKLPGRLHTVVRD